MAKLTKTQLAAKGKAIMTEAKRIRAKSPSKKWQMCVKEAGRKMRGKR